MLISTKSNVNKSRFSIEYYLRIITSQWNFNKAHKPTMVKFEPLIDYHVVFCTKIEQLC